MPVVDSLYFPIDDDGELARKMSHKDIYVVTSGEYSDYRIHAVFDTKVAAEEYAGTWADVEVHALNYVPKQPLGRKQYTVYVHANGEVSHVRDYGVYGHQWHITQLTDGRPYFHIECWARDEQHAVKIAKDRWRRIAALGLSPTRRENVESAFMEHDLGTEKHDGCLKPEGLTE